MKEKKKLYRHFDGMCWPESGEQLDDVAWRAVHATLTKKDLLVLVSVASAYQELIRLPARARAKIIRELRTQQPKEQP